MLRPLSPEHPDDETFEGLLIVRPEGRLYFVNAQNVAEQITALVAQYKPRVLALDMSRVPDLEYSALQALMEGEKRATERGSVVWLVGLNPGVLEMVQLPACTSDLAASACCSTRARRSSVTRLCRPRVCRRPRSDLRSPEATCG